MTRSKKLSVKRRVKSFAKKTAKKITIYCRPRSPGYHDPMADYELPKPVKKPKPKPKP